MKIQIECVVSCSQKQSKNTEKSSREEFGGEA
jgi:hypothetical protein